jgi:hypothetical protein
MAQNDTDIVGLPVPLESAALRPSLMREQTTAAFVSQLLAARDRMAPQRERRRASPESAVGAYSDSAQRAVRRMPAGYRTTIIA